MTVHGKQMTFGDISDEYAQFVEKFKPKKTTDDCYTPELVYEAVADFVASRYGLDRSRFVRPFFPGGDYQKFAYAPDAVVVDNPPLSILSEIVTWYAGHGIRFFLFAPTLTLFSSVSSSCCAALPCGVTVTYDNGANVSTSFLTNLEPEDVRVHTLPELFRAVKDANDANLGEQRVNLPKYIYPDEVVTAAGMARLCKYGQELVLTVSETEPVRTLDEQRQADKSIYGSGYLISERAAAERAAAERAALEYATAQIAISQLDTAQKKQSALEAAMRWTLSERERAIVARLSGKAVADDG